MELWESCSDRDAMKCISLILCLNEISGCSQEKLDILLGLSRNGFQYHLVHTDRGYEVELAEKFIDFGILKKRALMTASISRASQRGCDIVHPGTLNIS